MKLTGQKSECTACGLLFNTVSAFDKHRTGKHGADRRCMTVPEMLNKGMAQNARGWWVGSLRPTIPTGTAGAVPVGRQGGRDL